MGHINLPNYGSIQCRLLRLIIFSFLTNFHFVKISVIISAFFSKMQFLIIYFISCFSVGLLFFLLFHFFARPILSSAARPSCNKFGIWPEKDEGDFSKVQKTGHNGQKTCKNRSIFHTRRHVFARCDETVKDF